MNILKKIWAFFTELAIARQAGILVREGRSREAIDLVNGSKII